MKRSLLIAALAASGALAQPPKQAQTKPAADQKQARVKEETTPQKDLVCGMIIDPKTAEAKYAYKGKMYYFCSREDQQDFARAPDKYIKK